MLISSLGALATLHSVAIGALLREDTNSNAIAAPKSSFGEKDHAAFAEIAANLNATGVVKITSLRIGKGRFDLQSSNDLQIYAKSSKCPSLKWCYSRFPHRAFGATKLAGGVALTQLSRTAGTNERPILFSKTLHSRKAQLSPAET
jgi:hypothetical protein